MASHCNFSSITIYSQNNPDKSVKYIYVLVLVIPVVSLFKAINLIAVGVVAPRIISEVGLNTYKMAIHFENKVNFKKYILIFIKLRKLNSRTASLYVKLVPIERGSYKK